VSYVSEAIGYWTRGDSLMAELASTGTELQQEIAVGGADRAAIARLLARVHRMSGELAVLEDAFSRTLGAGARWASRVAFGMIVVAAAMLLLLAGLSEWRTVRRSQRAEMALRDSEARLRELVEQASFGIGNSTVDGYLLSANTALARMLGYPSAEALLAAGVPMSRMYRDSSDRERLLQHFAQEGVDRGEFEHELIRLDGATILVRVTARALRAGGGRLAAIEYFVEDVTARRALEGQLRQAQKMEAVGQLTGGIAHDFNNLLTVILSDAQLVQDALPAEAQQGRADLADLKLTARRGADMIRKLLAFSRTKQLQFHTYPAQDLVRSSTAVLRRVLPEDIEIRLELPAEPLFLRTDPAALEQMLLNLATNARDAMPGGGLLEITVGRVERRVTGDGPWVSVVVRDTGVGMDKATRDQLFEPFFTTKQPGHGTGLGMTMVYGLVTQHGGAVEVDSAPGKGTTVRLHLPIGTPEPPAAQSESDSPAPGSGTILLVEDEEALRRSARRLLEGHGYRVFVAEHGEEALQLYDRLPGSIDLVLSDVVMPRLGGRGLYETLRGRGDQVPFLFMSGYVAREGPGDLGLPEDVPFLPKPWDLDELIRHVQDAIRATGQCDGGPTST
jgi:two-component system, cell cycle sensor histidine kinase and response regulator CckA